MGLKCGIVGLTNVGKTTIFNCFSNTKAETTSYSFSTNKSNIGMAYVPDNRLKELEKYQTTEKLVPTTVDFVDIPGLAKGSSTGEGIGNKFLGDVRNCDALIHVLRCFENSELPHIEGSIDPIRDIEILDFELQIKDLESINKKIQKQEKLAKSGDKDAKNCLEVLIKYKNHLEDLKNVRELTVDENEKKHVEELCLLTDKPILYVCNVDTSSAAEGNIYSQKVISEFTDNNNSNIIIIAADLEADIAELESEEDKKEFLEDANLTEPSVNKLIRLAYNLLNLQTFFTVGEKEIKAWTIKTGYTAPQAAGVIHSDLERGFIRAEVMKYNDFIELGSEAACKKEGKFHIEGKNYIVENGDILHIRFNI